MRNLNLCLWQLVEALDLARATMAKVHQNLSWAVAYNVVAIPIAAGLLLPQFDFAMTPSLSGEESLFLVYCDIFYQWYEKRLASYIVPIVVKHMKDLHGLWCKDKVGICRISFVFLFHCSPVFQMTNAYPFCNSLSLHAHRLEHRILIMKLSTEDINVSSITSSLGGLMALSSIFVVSNSLLLQFHGPQRNEKRIMPTNLSK